ncbi:MAG: hypothetical protein ABJ242_00730 [Marinomonas sp.]
MSKQLAISSTFSVFAMACMLLLSTEDHSSAARGDAFMTVQAEMPNLDLTPYEPSGPSLLP